MFLEYATIGLSLFIIMIVTNKKMWNTIKFYLKYSFFVLYLIGTSFVAIPFVLPKPNSCESMMVLNYMMKPVSNFLGIKWKIRNTENINLEKNAIFVSNHQSMYDIVGMMYLWQMRSIKCVTIAKNELFWFWPVGLLMWLGGIVFIKRSGSVRTQKYINETAKQVFKNKHNLWFYVEGTRNKHPKKLLPFKKGAFRLAIEHQVPIIPIMYSPYYFINWKEKRFDSGTMIIDVLKPIQTTDFTMQNLDDLIDKTYETMSLKNKELREEVAQWIDR